MGFFGELLSFYLLFWLLSTFALKETLDPNQVKAAFAAGCMFVMVGIAHFAKRDKMEQMLAGLTRHARIANYVSGAFEIICGAGLFFNSTRLISALGLIALMFAVFPANINVARKNPGFYNISRLFFQPVYIIWLWWCTGWYWPF